MRDERGRLTQRMSMIRWCAGVKHALLGCLAVVVVAGPTSSQDGKTIFGDSRTQTLKAMRNIVKAVGAKEEGGCLYCHVKEKGKMNFVIDTPHKRVVRRMKFSFVDSLVTKGQAEITVDEEGEGKMHIAADYRVGGDVPGIHLSATVTRSEEEGAPKPVAQTYSAVVPLPENGAAITCITCHNGALHFLTEAQSK